MANFAHAKENEMIQPFGEIKWEDTIDVIVEKLIKLNITNINLGGPRQPTDNNISNKSDLLKMLDINSDMSNSIIGGPPKVYHIATINASPVMIKGVPYEIRLDFTNVPGLSMLLGNKVPSSGKLIYEYVLYGMHISNMSNIASNEAKNTIHSNISSKYSKFKMKSSGVKQVIDEKYVDRFGNELTVYINGSSTGINYRGTYAKAVENEIGKRAAKAKYNNNPELGDKF